MNHLLFFVSYPSVIINMEIRLQITQTFINRSPNLSKTQLFDKCTEVFLNISEAFIKECHLYKCGEIFIDLGRSVEKTDILIIRLSSDCDLIGSDSKDETNVSQIAFTISKPIVSTKCGKPRRSAHISERKGRKLRGDQISDSIIQCNSKGGKSRAISPDTGRLTRDSHGHST
jgi:hypothetical protein